MLIKEPTPIDAFLEIRHQLDNGQKHFKISGFGSFRRQLTEILDRQQCRFIVTGKTIYLEYD